jgi:hypothetical protein
MGELGTLPNSALPHHQGGREAPPGAVVRGGVLVIAVPDAATGRRNFWDCACVKILDP